MRSVIGWDIGGVNTKVAWVRGGEVLAVRGRPYELQRAPQALASVLRELAAEIGADADAAHAVTMTAELSQMFRTKREGVAFVLDAVEAAFPSAEIGVYAVDGSFVTTHQARQRPLSVAAANWSATAHHLARHVPDALLIDTGTTTTDIIPIAGGKVVACGRTDPERLASGELVYTGVVRTPVEAIASHVPWDEGTAGVSAEGFALAGDVHVWRGSLDPADYTAPTPDGRAATREFAGERLARVVCADREMLADAGVTRIADALAEAQAARINEGIRRVLRAHPSLRLAVVTGVGAFLGERAAQSAGLRVRRLADTLGGDAARCAPAACVALLREGPETKKGSGVFFTGAAEKDSRPLFQIDTVVKLGGGVLADEARFGAVLASISMAARRQRLVVVPGGGVFADSVRDADRRLGLSDDAAHWMAILAMDQYAYVIAERITGGVIVTDAHSIASALASNQLPVLAPSRWLRDADPLPHSWDVTSDSLSAWIAGQLDATRLVLIKPAGADPDRAVDPYLDRVLPQSVTKRIVSADQIAGGSW